MTTRIFAYALLALLLPSAAWAHRCGPGTLEVKKGETADYGITGSDFIEYQILDKGDPLVATIEPPRETTTTMYGSKLQAWGAALRHSKSVGTALRD